MPKGNEMSGACTVLAKHINMCFENHNYNCSSDTFIMKIHNIHVGGAEKLKWP